MEEGVRDVQGLPLFAKPAPRQSYASMAGKPAPSSHEPPRQRNQAPVTLIYQGKKNNGRDGGEWEEEWGQKNDPKAKRREWPPGNAVLSTRR